ncbi:hypothetical protein [Geomicrobium sp. JCM 19055]|uniref:hypothetical protein n=1 Tax=Geomicrobium sp. JCM 19055 TaxID=1460649 RepID=UPI00045ED922|nr:hypothetical protein [Geomicrobium sp. JCM 19055]GAJ98970.1 hypothetical protein JCM19055_1941 [Geomicrobium sp. JCM 19055]
MPFQLLLFAGICYVGLSIIDQNVTRHSFLLGSNYEEVLQAARSLLPVLLGLVATWVMERMRSIRQFLRRRLV